MINEKSAVRMRIGVPHMAASKRFGRYKREHGKVLRQARSSEDRLKELTDAFRAFITHGGDADKPVESIVEGLSYSSEDVERFSLALNEFEGFVKFPDSAGFFLSMLVKEGKEEQYTIHTSHLREIHCIGYMNDKEIMVEGDVGGHLAWEMTGGSILVAGDAGSYIGSDMTGGRVVVEGDAGRGVGVNMADGAIIIEGDAADTVGESMKGGEIIVRGNAGRGVGQAMEGGVIHIDGEFDFVAGVKHGRIYHKGKLIIDR
jgi:formylmethanofuran dehydrogenase subunit C